MKTTPKDFFLHLGATVALYASAIALINLAFTTINYALPDRLASYFSSSSIVWPISMLIVLIPILYVIEWTIAREARLVPEKKQLWIRRWRIYLTLFLTGATIAGDLIALINTYLNGEISSRFIWKIITVLVVCAIIFAYYLLDKMTDEGRGRTWKKILSWLGLVVVLAAIIFGFTVIGSPAKQRAIRFDLQRINDLMNIQSQTAYYWQRTQKLPDTLRDLNDQISGFTVPKDPDTAQPYEYKKTGPKSFEICATFSLPSDQEPGIGRGSYDGSYPMPVGDTSNWDHPAGHACFERTINSSLYPLIKGNATL
jgi:hypothetical protein